MFFGTSDVTGGLGVLVNQAAISMTRANAYNAAKQALGPKASAAVVYEAGDNYLKYVIPRTNRALTVFEISRDINFRRMLDAAKEAGAAKAISKAKDADPILDVSDYSLTGSLFGSVPNYLILGVAAAGGYWYWKKKHKKKKRATRSTKRSIGATASTPVIGGAA